MKLQEVKSQKGEIEFRKKLVEQQVMQKCLFVDEPVCFENGSESKLTQGHSSFSCPACHNSFPIIDNILFCFSPQKFQELYPEIFGAFKPKEKDKASAIVTLWENLFCGLV